MTRALRYRRGFHPVTFRPLVGWAHVVRSLGIIWSTRLDTRVMRLEFGSDHFSLLAEDITPDLALRLYDALIGAAHKHEPEYRIKTMQLVKVARDGTLAVRHGGVYYPEGRFGIYDHAQEMTATAPLHHYREAA